MAWPTNPTNGQTTTINGVVYVYNSTKNAWGPAALSTVTTINYTGNVAAANVNVTGNVYVGQVPLPTLTTLLTYSLAF